MFRHQKLALNVLAWLIYSGLFLGPELLTGEAYQEGYLSFFFGFSVVMAGLVYTNSKWLIPRFLRQKKYIIYVLGGIILIVFHALIAQYLFHQYLAINTSDFAQDLKSELQLQPSYPSLDWLNTLFPSVLFFITSTAIYLATHWFFQRKQIEQLEKQRLKAEVAMLKHQIHPHFLLNVINNLYGMSIKVPQQVPQMLLSLSEMLQYMLYEGNQHEQVPLKKELRYLESYINLQRMRFGHQLIIDYTVQTTAVGYYVVPLVLIIFVENAFKHCFYPTFSSPKVVIQLTVQDQQLCMNVSNTAEKAPPSVSKGMGLHNVRQRLDRLYQNRYRLQLRQDEASYHVTLHFPLHVHELSDY